MGVPETPNTQGSPRLLTVPEITERYGISRQAIHTYRQRGVFPQPAPEQGSTRLRFREDEVDAFFVANPKRPGRRTDRETAAEGEPMSTAPDPLPEMFGGLARMMSTASRDWGEYAPDAWLYGVFVGWDCEDEHEHDDICGGTAAMEEMAARHGWSPETVARLRRYRAAVLASTGEPFPDPRFSRKPPTA